jgi:hypothetical protein
LLQHREYCSIATFWAKIPLIIGGLLGIVCGISKYLCIYPVVSHCTPNDILWNPGCELLVYCLCNPNSVSHMGKQVTDSIVMRFETFHPEPCGSCSSKTPLSIIIACGCGSHCGALMSFEIYMELNIPKTNIIYFTHKSGKVTQLTVTAVQRDTVVTITSVRKGNIMTAMIVFLLPFCTIN